MTEPWASDRELDLDGAKAAIGGQFPDLLEATVKWLGSGWDYDVVRTGQWVVRFPRRRVARTDIERERSVLRLVQVAVRRCGVNVPAIERIGEPGPHFPYHFAVSQYIAGVDIDKACGGFDASHLAALLSDLHAIPTKLCREAGIEDLSYGVRGLAEHVVTRSDAVRPGLLDGAISACEPWLSGSVGLPPEAPAEPAFIHNDLLGEHVLVDPDDGRIAGILDFGDAALGDPAVDFANLIVSLGHRAVRPVLDAYASPDLTLWDRAVFWAQALALVYLDEEMRIGNDLAPMLHRLNNAFTGD